MFSIPSDDTTQRRERIAIGDGHHIVCWPVPLYRQLIHAIGCDRALHPVWLSAWGSAAHTLTNHSMMQAFPVAYPLSSRRERYAKMRFSAEQYAKLDRKLIAAVYYLCSRRYERVVWIEDGFTEDVQGWASSSGNVRLIDTTEQDVKDMLLSREPQAVREFVAMLKG